MTAELPANATMSRLLPALVTKMRLPAHIQYEVQHEQSGRLLDRRDTLSSADVQTGDTLNLLPLVVSETDGETPKITVDVGESAASDRVTVTVTDQAGGQTVMAELPTNAPMSRLLPTLVTEMMLPTNVEYGIQHKQSGKQLTSTDTLTSVGVQSGDTLRLLPDVTAGGGIPIRSFRDIQLVEAVLTHNHLKARMRDMSLLFAVFLYTEEDQKLASYIREHIQELHQMSGYQCWFLTIERPTAEWDLEIRRSLGELAGEYFDAIWERLGPASFRPFEKAHAYEIGQQFEVKPMQFPCIVFFSELRSKQIVTIAINDFVQANEQDMDAEYTRFFRVLFSVTQQATAGPRKDWLPNLGRLLVKEL